MRFFRRRERREKPGKKLYTLHTTDEQNKDPEQQAQIMRFLRAHGIDPELVLVGNGNALDVIQTADYRLWLRAWRATDKSMVDCPHCPGCIKQEQVIVPLVAAPPIDLPDAHFYEPGFKTRLLTSAVRGVI